MRISTKDWQNYIKKLSALSKTAGELMTQYVQKNGFSDKNALIEYAYALVTKYGEGAAEISALMYDAIAEMEKATVEAAIPAETANISETAKAINGALKQSPTGQLLDTVVQRLVKQAGADTTLKNALRDRAQFAWIPSGDTCAFCITLASRGWQYMSKDALKNGHAEHIHSHCDCQYAIRFNENTNVEGYDPKVYEDMYYAESGKPQDKINAMRRKAYADNKEKINEQKRIAYHNRTRTAQDVTKEYLGKGNEGKGVVSFLNGITAAEMRDRETASWIHDKIGGDITCLPENSLKGKNPDAKWENNYWEFKRPTSKNAVDDRLRKANQQLTEAMERDGIIGNRSGVVVDISGMNLSLDETIAIVENRAAERLKNNTDVIIRNGNTIEKIIRIKK